MQCSSTNLFIEEEKYKVLLLNQRIEELRKRREEKQEKKPNNGEDSEICRKRKFEYHTTVFKSNERKFLGKLSSMHPPASEMEETNSERK
jgi:hypothetical protein